MGLLTLPTGKNEFYDGTNWYQLASEPWVIDKIGAIPPCKVATTGANLVSSYVNGASSGIGATLTNAATPQAALIIDGQTLSINDRVLVKDQTNNTQNGIYSVTTTGSTSINWVLTRVIDFDSSPLMNIGDVIQVIMGTVNAVTSWMLTSTVTTVGTSPITFSKFGSINIGGTTNQIVVTTGASGSTISFPTGAVALPSGARPSTPVAGMIRWNSTPTPSEILQKKSIEKTEVINGS